MAKEDSRRIYVTLNKNKEKDRIIEAYLSQSYNEADAIKEAIYRLATNNIQLVQLDANSTEKVQLVPKDNNKVLKDKVSKSNKKVQNGAVNTEKVIKDTIPISYETVIKDINSTEKVQLVPKDNETVQKDSFKIKQQEKKKTLVTGLNYFNNKG